MAATAKKHSAFLCAIIAIMVLAFVILVRVRHSNASSPSVVPMHQQR
jgi:hypothetical protein